ncbi:tyrosine-type recombinase/integrase [Acinetobacter puyangensis]|uniref:tyrosine-type recombinase/integrase n=1 Tax=Acinetobacter puyangensis TaxID=1096779 RepID=UPI003A4E40F9
MATFRKRGTTWRAELSVNGNRLSASFDTKAQAKAWASEKETELRNSPYIQKNKHTMADAITRYSETVSIKNKGVRWEQIRLKKFIRTAHFSNYKIADVTSDDISLWRDDLMKTLAPASIVREMGLMRSVFETARLEWGWIKTNPMNDVKKPKRPKHRDRRVSESEIKTIISALGYNDDIEVTTKNQEVAIAFLLAIETAMRAGELMGLEWQNVHLESQFVQLLDTKNGDSRNVPLSKRAVFLIKKLKGEKRIFTVEGGSLSTLFRKARDKNDIQDLHFHDTRHEACTRLAKKLQVLDLARMIGHRDLRSLMIYYNATAAEIATQLD